MPLFNSIKESIIRGQIDFTSDTFKVLLISGQPYDLDAVSYCDIAEETIVGEKEGYLLNNIGLSRMNHSDLIWTADNVVACELEGPQINQVIIYKSTATGNCTKDLLVWGKNVTYRPDKTDLEIAWGSYIFNLAGKGGGDDFYYHGKLSLFSGQIDMAGGTKGDIRVVLFNGYTAPVTEEMPETINDIVLGDLPFVVADEALTHQYFSPDGALDAADTVFSNLSGPQVTDIALVQWNTSDPTQSLLIAYFREGMNLPFNPDGSTTAVKWNNSPPQVLCI